MWIESVMRTWNIPLLIHTMNISGVGMLKSDHDLKRPLISSHLPHCREMIMGAALAQGRSFLRPAEPH